MAKIKPFEEHSDKYDEWFDKNQDAYNAELETVSQVMPPLPSKGLEVGVGSGKFAGPLGIGIGVEPAENMAVKAERLGIRVFRGVAEKLPFPDSEFDFVLMVTTICFVDDVLQSFKEALRVLKPEGSLIVGFVDRESELGKTYFDSRQSSTFYKEATFFSAPEVSKYLTDAGFENLIFKQTLIPGGPQGIIQNGFGKGAFVVAKGVKSGSQGAPPEF